MKIIKSILIATVFLIMACNSAPDNVNDIEGTWKYKSLSSDGSYEETYKIKHLEENKFSVDVRKFFDAKEGKQGLYGELKDNDRKDTWEMTLNEEGTKLKAWDGTPLIFSDDYQTMKNKDDYIFKKIEE